MVQGLPTMPMVGHKNDLSTVFLSDDRSASDQETFLPTKERRRRRNLGESLESYRSYLFAIAYRMLGSAMDAEDMVQETYLRYQGTPPETIGSLKAFLTTIISRLCVDQLHLAYRKREQYLGPWLTEPIITADTLEVISPEERV